jgi:hypothetical protein
MGADESIKHGWRQAFVTVYHGPKGSMMETVVLLNETDYIINLVLDDCDFDA